METIQSRKEGKKIERELRVIANLIKTERKKQKLSLATLSKMVYGNEFRAKDLSEIERGLKPLVPFTTICHICKSLGIAVV